MLLRDEMNVNAIINSMKLSALAAGKLQLDLQVSCCKKEYPLSLFDNILFLLISGSDLS